MPSARGSRHERHHRRRHRPTRSQPRRRSAANRALSGPRVQRARRRDDPLSPVPDAADLLAREHEPEDQHGDHLRPDALAAGDHLRQLHQDLHRRELVLGLHQLAHLCGHQHGAVDRPRAAGGLCLLALPLPRRQAPVLLAAHQPHGAAGGVRAALLQSLFGHRALRHALGGGAGALPVQRAAGGVDPRRLHVRRAAGDRRDGGHRRLFASRASS